MNCPNCSQSLPVEALFCGECGQAVAPPVLAPAQILPFVEPPQLFHPHNATASPDGDGDGDGDGDDSACDECGAVLSFGDIFCGVCGHVSPAVSAAFSSARDTSLTEAIRPSAPERPTDGTQAPRLRAPEATIDLPSPGPFFAGPAQDAVASVAGAPSERFVLQFSTGESVTVSGTGLVGRNPVHEPGEYFDHLVQVLDSTRSVSKTHLEFGQQAGVFWVSDRYSGNGTIVREPDRPGIRCEPAKRQIVARGARVIIGEQFFVVS